MATTTISEKPYEGELLDRSQPFDFSDTSVIIVSGEPGNDALGKTLQQSPAAHYPPVRLLGLVVENGNFCGHMLLKTGSTYVHVARLYGFPRWMNQQGFERYLKENNKRLISRTRVKVPNPDAANQKLNSLLGSRWLWLGAVNNCSTFVADVLKAGGAQPDLSNCPVLSEQQWK